MGATLATIGSSVDRKLFGSGAHADGEAFAGGANLIVAQDAVEGALSKGEVAASTQAVRVVAEDGHARRLVSDVSEHAVHHVVVLDLYDDDLVDNAIVDQMHLLSVSTACCQYAERLTSSQPLRQCLRWKGHALVRAHLASLARRQCAR